MKSKSEIPHPGALFWEPRDGYYKTKVKIHKDHQYPIQINSTLMSITNAKIIHEWLGKAIAYLEQEKK